MLSVEKEALLFDALEQAGCKPISAATRKRLDTMFGELLLAAVRQFSRDVVRIVGEESLAEKVLDAAADKVLLAYLAQIGDDVIARTGKAPGNFKLRREVGIKASLRIFLGEPLDGVEHPGLLRNVIGSKPWEQNRQTVSLDPYLNSGATRDDGDGRVLARQPSALVQPPSAAHCSEITMLLRALEKLYADSSQRDERVALLVFLSSFGIDLDGRALTSQGDLLGLIDRLDLGRDPKRRCRQRVDGYAGGEVTAKDLAAILDTSCRHVTRLKSRASETVKAIAHR